MFTSIRFKCKVLFIELLLGDLLFAFSTMFLANWVLTIWLLGNRAVINQSFWFEVAFFPFFVVTGFFYLNFYDKARYLQARELFVIWCRVMTVWFLLVVVFRHVVEAECFWSFRATYSSLISGVVVLLWRFFSRALFEIHQKREKVLILGVGEMARNIAREVIDNHIPGFRISGFIGPEKLLGTSIVNPKIIGTYDQIDTIVQKEKISAIVMAEQDRRNLLPMDSLIDFRLSGGMVFEAADFMEMTIGRVPLESIKPAWFIFSTGFNRSFVYRIVKRFFEILFSTILLVITLPLNVIVALLIKLDSPGPVFYRQARVGKNGKLFNILKFRSMKKEAEADGKARWAKGGDSRTTRIGRIIRPLRIDEIPQLWTILFGKMSLVGPRPERPEFVKDLSEKIPFYDKRHTVTPGLTGWAQINYRYGSSFEDAKKKLEYDFYYIKHMSIFLDLFIVAKTARTVLIERSGL